MFAVCVSRNILHIYIQENMFVGFSPFYINGNIRHILLRPCLFTNALLHSRDFLVSAPYELCTFHGPTHYLFSVAFDDQDEPECSPLKSPGHTLLQ